MVENPENDLANRQVVAGVQVAPSGDLAGKDLTVVMTESGLVGWRGASELNWKPSQKNLSGFHDAMTYLHALNGGAIHGA